MVACSWSQTSSSHDKSHHGLFSEHPTDFLTDIGFHSMFPSVCLHFSQEYLSSLRKIESSKTDGCRHPLSISIRKQDDTLTLLKTKDAVAVPV